MGIGGGIVSCNGNGYGRGRWEWCGEGILEITGGGDEGLILASVEF